MQLDGFLSSFPLSELLELSVASMINGAIEVYAPAGLHRLFFVEGTLVHATSPDASGFDAFWPLFELGDAAFRFVASAAPTERTITEPVRPLIAQAAALARQWSAIRPDVSSLNIVPELVSPAHGEHVRIFEEDWPILSSVDGQRSIAAVAQHAKLDAIEVCVGLVRLKERGLVQFCGPRPAVELLAPPEDAPVESEVVVPAPSAPDPAVGYFARLLGNVPDVELAPLPEAPPELSPTPTAYEEILLVLRS